MMNRNKSMRADSNAAALSMKGSMVTDSMRFAEFDKNQDQQLDFDEFYEMQPKNIKEKFSVSDVRAWFNAADLDGSGTLSMEEYFKWSLGSAAQKHGSRALEAAFQKYDKDGTGRLDAIEFTLAAEEFGFGAVANDIFRKLDTDGSGTLTYKELVESFQVMGAPKDGETTRMLTALMWAYDDEMKREATESIDTSNWVIRGRDQEAVRTELRQLLIDSGGSVADIIYLFDEDKDHSLSIEFIEFHRTMKTKLGYKGSMQVLDGVFRSMDDNSSGYIGFDELYEFIHGYRHSLDKRNKKDWSLHLPKGLTFDDIAWDAEVLRTLIKEMLKRAKIGVADLMLGWLKGRARAIAMASPSSSCLSPKRVRTRGGWRTTTGAFESAVDRSGRRGFTQKTFLAKVKDGFFKDAHPDLWENELSAIVTEAFNTMMVMLKGENFFHEIGLHHLERWLEPESSLGEGDERLPLKTPAQLHMQTLRRERSSREQLRRQRRSSNEMFVLPTNPSTRRSTRESLSLERVASAPIVKTPSVAFMNEEVPSRAENKFSRPTSAALRKPPAPSDAMPSRPPSAAFPPAEPVYLPPPIMSEWERHEHDRMEFQLNALESRVRRIMKQRQQGYKQKDMRLPAGTPMNLYFSPPNLGEEHRHAVMRHLGKSPSSSQPMSRALSRVSSRPMSGAASRPMSGSFLRREKSKSSEL